MPEIHGSFVSRISLVKNQLSKIGLWAAFGISGHIIIKIEGKSPKYRKITGFQFEIGSQKFLFGWPPLL
jgi:hypothetical protein